MYLERYELKTEKSGLLFEFVSIGPKGQIQKLIKFSEMVKGLYNLGFGDKQPGSNDVNDTSVSNNGDREKILSTVVSAIYAFTDKNAGNWIYAAGSTKARNRLYRMGISKYLNKVQADFDLYGFRNDNWEFFVKGIEYEAFLAKRKI